MLKPQLRDKYVIPTCPPKHHAIITATTLENRQNSLFSRMAFSALCDDALDVKNSYPYLNLLKETYTSFYQVSLALVPPDMMSGDLLL